MFSGHIWLRHEPSRNQFNPGTDRNQGAEPQFESFERSVNVMLQEMACGPAGNLRSPMPDV